MKPPVALLVFSAAIFVLFSSTCCLAQHSGGAASLQIDPSVRAAGMGQVSSAVFWDIGLNDWANPAVLGYERGIRIEHGRTRLSPGLPGDVHFTTDRVLLGAYGIGVCLGGEPIDGLGKTRLSYGNRSWYSSEGQYLGEFTSREKARSWGVGVSLAMLIDGLAGSKIPVVRQVTRFGDVALGITVKRVEINLAPDWAFPDMPPGGGTAKASAHDRGGLYRLTPYNSLDSRGWLPELDRALDPFLGGFRFDFSWGRSLSNYGHEKLVFISASNADPMPKVSRRGWARHFAVGCPGLLRDAIESAGLGIVAQSLSPLVEWGQGGDRTHSEVYKDELPVKHTGSEITFAGIYTIRSGHIEDRAGDIIDDTSGWGIGFRVGRFGRFRYDEATLPQARDLPEKVHRKGWTAEVDPLAIWEAIRGPRSSSGSY